MLEIVIALNYLIMVLHRPVPFKIMACILNTKGECTNGVGKEQARKWFASLAAEVSALLWIESVACEGGGGRL